METSNENNSEKKSQEVVENTEALKVDTDVKKEELTEEKPIQENTTTTNQNMEDLKEGLENKTESVPAVKENSNEENYIKKPANNEKKRVSNDIIANFEADEQYQYIKRRKIKVAGAPKMPLTGYVRYMNDRRETLRKNFPTKTALDLTRMIAEEWSHLPEDKKLPYTKAADEDKKRYITELNNFLRENPDVLASELAKNKTKKLAADNKAAGAKEKAQPNAANKGNKEATKNSTASTGALHAPEEKAQIKAPVIAQKRKRSPTPSVVSNGHDDMPSSVAANIVAPIPGEIPIFTTEFLEHNKNSDANLRILRKSKADLEQQNAVLEKHVENMKTGVAKMTVENNALEEKNRLLELYLSKLKQKLAKALGGLGIPTEPDGATVDNIEKYMCDLYQMSSSNTASLNKAKDILRKLDLQIQL